VKYAKEYDYGKLSGKVIDDLMNNTRELKGQDDKKNPIDFALWKKGSPEHIMKWTSPWNTGFPGWHLECSAMGAKYLGLPFDIHGGGLDLMFPHHESEIAQANAAFGENPCKYWIHNNMITINGQKMAKSLGNFITLEDLFEGKHKLLSQAFSPNVTRFFILMAHYRSTIDFSNDALLAAEKGLDRLMTAYSKMDQLQVSESSTLDIKAWSDRCYAMLNDDLNTARLIAELFEGAKYINLLLDKKESLNKEDLVFFTKQMKAFVEDILGLQLEDEAAGSENIEGFINLLLELRAKARENKDWAASDLIRDQLKELGVIIKDGKEGASWEWA